jgi:hypothetical protein
MGLAPTMTLGVFERTKRFVFAVLPLMLPAALAAQGSLSVTVFEDHNGYGARDAGERTIPNVVIPISAT